MAQRVSDEGIEEDISHGVNTTSLMMAKHYGKTDFHYDDPDYKHLSKRLLSLRRFHIVKVVETVGREHVYAMDND